MARVTGEPTQVWHQISTAEVVDVGDTTGRGSSKTSDDCLRLSVKRRSRMAKTEKKKSNAHQLSPPISRHHARAVSHLTMPPGGRYNPANSRTAPAPST